MGDTDPNAVETKTQIPSHFFIAHTFLHCESSNVFYLLSLDVTDKM